MYYFEEVATNTLLSEVDNQGVWQYGFLHIYTLYEWRAGQSANGGSVRIASPGNTLEKDAGNIPHFKI